MRNALQENLTKASDSAAFVVSDLRAANTGANPLESLAILPLIAEAAALQQRIAAVLSAIESHQGVKP